STASTGLRVPVAVTVSCRFSTLAATVEKCTTGGVLDLLRQYQTPAPARASTRPSVTNAPSLRCVRPLLTSFRTSSLRGGGTELVGSGSGAAVVIVPLRTRALGGSLRSPRDKC